MKNIVCAFVTLLILLSPVSGQTTTGKITGQIYDDTDKDGVKGGGEEGTAGETVEVWVVLEDGTRKKVAEVVTDEEGNYEFNGLPIGEYVLVFRYSTGITVESVKSIVLTEANPVYAFGNTPYLTPPSSTNYNLLSLGLRNPSNFAGPEVSRFRP